jgi:hypothetical protein
MFSGMTSGTAARGRKNLSDRKGRSESFFPIEIPHRFTRGSPRGTGEARRWKRVRPRGDLPVPSLGVHERVAEERSGRFMRHRPHLQ